MTNEAPVTTTLNFFTVGKKTLTGEWYIHVNFGTFEELAEWVHLLDGDVDDVEPLFSIALPEAEPLPYEPQRQNGRPAPRAQQRPARKPAPAGPECSFCGGPTYDNTATKQGNQPDYRCRDREFCGGAGWLQENGTVRWRQ